MVRRIVQAAFVCLACAGIVAAQSAGGSRPAAQSPLERAGFLLGEWTTHDETELGHADAVSSFASDLDRHVVIRRSSTKFTSGRNAGTGHDDLLILYVQDSRLRAVYFDSEGHTIQYSVSFPSPNTALFESDPGQPGPRYRLTHRVTGSKMETKFEIALPGTGFHTHVSSTSTRK
jgi:hypothetical protein